MVVYINCKGVEKPVRVKAQPKLAYSWKGGYYAPVHRRDRGVTYPIKLMDRKSSVSRIVRQRSHVGIISAED